jgi:hypothetical protein
MAWPVHKQTPREMHFLQWLCIACSAASPALKIERPCSTVGVGGRVWHKPNIVVGARLAALTTTSRPDWKHRKTTRARARLSQRVNRALLEDEDDSLPSGPADKPGERTSSAAGADAA